MVDAWCMARCMTLGLTINPRGGGTITEMRGVITDLGGAYTMNLKILVHIGSRATTPSQTK